MKTLIINGFSRSKKKSALVVIAPVTRKGEGGNRRQIITKPREESKQREKGEDRRIAPNEDE